MKRPRGVNVAATAVRAAGFAGLGRTATRATFGAAALRSWSCLLLSLATTLDNPVAFLPGRAKLVTRPLSTGSLTSEKTIGTVAV